MKSLALAAASAVWLVACGGGGDDPVADDGGAPDTREAADEVDETANDGRDAATPADELLGDPVIVELPTGARLAFRPPAAFTVPAVSCTATVNGAPEGFESEVEACWDDEFRSASHLHGHPDLEFLPFYELAVSDTDDGCDSGTGSVLYVAPHPGEAPEYDEVPPREPVGDGSNGVLLLPFRPDAEGCLTGELQVPLGDGRFDLTLISRVGDVSEAAFDAWVASVTLDGESLVSG